MRLADLDRKLTDTAYVLPFQKLSIANLAVLRAKMKKAGQSYEGLEALVLDRGVVYLSVETATPSANCYLLKGTVREKVVVLDTTFLVPLAKPLAANGSHVYNAGFEALANSNKQLFAFFEFNSFPNKNSVYAFNSRRLQPTSAARSLPFDKLPFRLTDLTAAGRNHFTGINYFFKGEGEDTVYRTPASDSSSAKLVMNKGVYKNYCRLVDVELRGTSFSWKPIWKFPEQYSSYNWEGIAAYKDGYFIINDKYSPARPYRTTLLYLQKAK